MKFTKYIKKKIFYLIYLVLITFFLCESIVRTLPGTIPPDLINYLSQEAVNDVFNKRGFLQNDKEGIYHYRPFQKLRYRSHINIDENGFRNSEYNQKNIDIVILGDSIVFARDSKKDLGDLFRIEGNSVLNLGMGGYAPQHYRDVYKKYVIDKKIPHNKVLVNIFVGNDFGDSKSYPWRLEPKGSGNPNYPWLVNLFFGAFEIYDNSKVFKKKIDESKYRISLPYGEIGLLQLWWNGDPSNEEWNKVNQALDDIVIMADKASAEVIFVIIPSPVSVYGVNLHSDFKHFVDYQNRIIKKFKNEFNNINIVDPTKDLALAINNKFLYTTEADCHFNEHGITVLHSIIKSNLK
jgi:hypothetical protein|tara:strand:- start:2977 stop:4026 length:1050 start_codon:yes stop_codon:yes gene_type:complete